MPLFIKMPTGQKLYAEIAGWSSAPAPFDMRREGGEVILWIGRLNLIYTPRSWKPPRRAFGEQAHARLVHPTGPDP